MCGIIAAITKENKSVREIIAKQFEEQKSRGQQGFGFAHLLPSGKVEVYKTQTFDEIKEPLNASKSRAIMFHHRLPTSIANVAEAAHPIFVGNDELKHDYWVIHNGVISNHSTLMTKFESLGYTYFTKATEYKALEFVNIDKTVVFGDGLMKANDSESLAIDFCRTLEGKQPLMESVGTIALIAFQLEKGTEKLVKVLWGHNDGNPLTIRKKEYADGSGLEGVLLSSTGGAETNTDTLFTLDPFSMELGEKDFTIGFYSSYKYQKPKPTTKTDYSGAASNMEAIDRAIAELTGEVNNVEEKREVKELPEPKTYTLTTPMSANDMGVSTESVAKAIKIARALNVPDKDIKELYQDLLAEIKLYNKVVPEYNEAVKLLREYSSPGYMAYKENYFDTESARVLVQEASKKLETRLHHVLSVHSELEAHIDSINDMVTQGTLIYE